MNDHNELKICWIIFGNGFEKEGGLRYWEPVLREFCNLLPMTAFITDGKICDNYRTEFSVKSVGKTWRKYFFLMKLLLRDHYDVVLCIEYSYPTLCSAIVKLISKFSLFVLQESFPRVKMFFIRKCYRKLLSYCVTYFVANNVPAVKYLRDCLGVKKDKIGKVTYLVPPEIDYFDKSITKKSANRPIFLFVGQLIELKNPNILIDVAFKLHREGLKFSLWLVGSGVQQKMLEEKVMQLGLGEMITFFGQVDYSKIGSFYREADVFVLPTYGDYRSVVLQEAARHGLALLGSIYDGSAEELIRDGETGFLFDPRDSGQLERLMRALIKDDGLVKKISASSARLMKDYTPRKSALGLCDAILSVMPRC